MAINSKPLDFVYEPVLTDLDRVQGKLIDIAMNQPFHLSKQVDHVVSNLGKGIRPVITLLASKFHSNDGLMAEIMATAVELLHVATLVHDDTVDKADMRRGVATVSKLWDQNTAVLIGDYIFARSATLVCETNNVRVIKRFAETIMELSSGQLNELARAYKWPQTQDQYLDCISLKTASLFETSSETGAILSGADEKLIDALKRYGRNLGMAFQIIDDILDIYGSENETGKPIGQDLVHGIITLPSLLAINKSVGKNPIANMFKNPKDENLVAESIQFIQDQHVADECYQIARNYCDNALAALNVLESNKYKESLIELVTYVVNRWN